MDKLNKLLFSIDYYKILENDKYSMLLECYVVSEGSNKHNTYISINAINEAYPTIANKPIVCVYDGFDFKEHARNQMDKEREKCIGIVPETNNGEIVTRDGKLWQKVDILIWKDYNPKLVERVLKNTTTKISMEIDILKSHTRNDGLVEIDSYVYCGICLLGTIYTEAIPGANVNIIKYSSYNKQVNDINNMYFSLKENKLVNIPVNIQDIIKIKFSKNPNYTGYINKDNLEYEKLIELYNVIDNKEYRKWFCSIDNKTIESETKIERKEYSMKELMAILKNAILKENKNFSVFGCDSEYCYGLDENKKMYRCKYSDNTVDFSTMSEMYSEGLNFTDTTNTKDDTEKDTLKKENEELKKVNMALQEEKDKRDKTDKQNEANKLYAEYKDYLNETDVEEFNKILFSCDFDVFKAKVSDSVLPKIVSKLNVLNDTKNKDVNDNTQKIDYTLFGFKGTNMNNSNNINDSITLQKIKELKI